MTLSVDSTASSSPESVLSVAKLAKALAERALHQADPSALSDVIINLDSCFSYDFTSNIVDFLKDAWAKQGDVPFPFEQLALPTIMTMAQEGSMGWGGSSMAELLSSQKDGIQKDGGVKGARILQCVQPMAYEDNDMTFFVPEKGGRLLEMGANERRHRRTDVEV